MNKKWEAVIGLEIHVQLNTDTKLFCRCENYKHDNIPNTSVCPVCMGFPGALPVLSEKALEYAIKLGLALNCEIASKTIWYRKNYFYPDLPAGYQISQLENPLSKNGYIEILNSDMSISKIRINRAHLENDAGKLVHTNYGTLLDFNRAGTPLVEIVTEPDIRSANEAKLVVQEIQKIARTIGVSNADMEKGNLRCDANISVRPVGQKEYNTRVEIKNLNSFKHIENAINHEIERQIEIYESGNQVEQETRGYNIEKNETYIMRSKEDAHDYKYFPDPDIVPFEPDISLIEKIKSELPELPIKKQIKFINEYKIDFKDSSVLAGNEKLSNYMEILGERVDKQLAKSWVLTIILREINEKCISIDELKYSIDDMIVLLNMIKSGEISNNIAKEKIYPIMADTGKSPIEIIKELGIKQINNDEEIIKIIENIISKYTKQIEEYKNGNTKVFTFLIGQIMKETNGQINPKKTNELLKNILENYKL